MYATHRSWKFTSKEMGITLKLHYFDRVKNIPMIHKLDGDRPKISSQLTKSSRRYDLPNMELNSTIRKILAPYRRGSIPWSLNQNWKGWPRCLSRRKRLKSRKSQRCHQNGQHVRYKHIRCSLLNSREFGLKWLVPGGYIGEPSVFRLWRR